MIRTIALFTVLGTLAIAGPGGSGYPHVLGPGNNVPYARLAVVDGPGSGGGYGLTGPVNTGGYGLTGPGSSVPYEKATDGPGLGGGYSARYAGPGSNVPYGKLTSDGTGSSGGYGLTGSGSSVPYEKATDGPGLGGGYGALYDGPQNDGNGKKGLR